ncbi:methylmalonate-semialdehyde dehydrogenase [acylating], mitochondrial [Olea europaea subsp. europaea]|uniref:Methylmalonate-semialdehyde dehydrogenase [acylating], mitochondrial n=1 Tax=Olea europaea subsp. europaea TaxID=158383 RepID=A0A8S0QCP3_OLEEU|nr:methylmalonate-semialdehyde dehydrogenase [acylating], mitochondrial [Olea europaea subsp. europaea]
MKEHQLVENVYSPTWEQRTMESYCLMQKLMLVAVGFGAAGRRCMALSTEIFVGDSKSWEEKLVERAKVLKVDIGTDPQADLGPVIILTFCFWREVVLLQPQARQAFSYTHRSRQLLNNGRIYQVVLYCPWTMAMPTPQKT